MILQGNQGLIFMNFEIFHLYVEWQGSKGSIW